MCMNNINTNVVFYKTGYEYKDQQIVDLKGATNKPKVIVEPIRGEENYYSIKELDFALLVNAIQNKNNPVKNPAEEIDLKQQYEIIVRMTETSSGEFVDLERRDLIFSTNTIELCRYIFTDIMFFSFGNIKVHKPPMGKNLCVLKILIKLKDDKEKSWFVQSMHPIEMELV